MAIETTTETVTPQQQLERERGQSSAWIQLFMLLAYSISAGSLIYSNWSQQKIIDRHRALLLEYEQVIDKLMTKIHRLEGSPVEHKP